jgi:F-type H+-transporting ATPase subunit a
MSWSLFAAGANPFTIFYPLGLNPALLHVTMSALVTIFLAYIAKRVYVSYKNADNAIVPDKELTLRNLIELVSEGLLNFFEGLMGDRAVIYFPLLATIFIYIFVSNLLGIIPGFLPPTDNINTNFPIALIVFVYYNMSGIKEHGTANYLKHFMGPIKWLAVLMVPIEIVSHIVRPISLSLRLFGNIQGDHMVLFQFSNLTPILVPIIFLGLGLFVCFMQAFVFTFLSAIYISMAEAHDH